MSGVPADYDRDAGFSLVEMIVTIIMFTLITGSITAVIVTTLHKQNAINARGTALANVRNALEQVDRDIRSSQPICYATGTEIAMLEAYPRTGAAKTIVDYAVSGTNLVYTRYTATQTPVPGATVVCQYTTLNGLVPLTVTYYESATPAPVTRTVLTNLVGTGTNPLFTTIPAGTVFSTCPTGGTAAAVSNSSPAITALTVSITIKPADLNKSVSASDCGTYLRNAVAPTTPA